MWREASIASRPGLPSLIDSAWSVDVADATTLVAKAATPTIRLDLRVRDAPSAAGAMSGERTVSVEMNHASLGALVDSLRKTKDQLGAMS